MVPVFNMNVLIVYCEITIQKVITFSHVESLEKRIRMTYCSVVMTFIVIQHTSNFERVSFQVMESSPEMARENSASGELNVMMAAKWTTTTLDKG